MEWLIEDALPPGPMAASLLEDWARAAPTLAQALQYGEVHATACDPRDTLASPAESWLLRRAGYVPPGDAPLGSGWPALELAPPDPAPVWLALPCELHVTQQGVTLLDPRQNSLEPSETASLLEAIRGDLSEAGIAVIADAGPPWRFRLPADWTPYGPTPACAAGQEVQHWWPQHAGARGWRRLLNLIQMVWHDHPVNQARAARGGAPINSLWLYGGGSADHMPAAAAARQVRRESSLAESYRRGDWAGWLAALAEFDRRHLAAFAGQWRTGDGAHRWVLTGGERWVELTPRPRRGLARWWPRRPRHDALRHLLSNDRPPS
ncbi:MAG: hypothetical protein M0R28_14300 [Pigmentiphaga sp.]|nr:hypothetical protein [Pigmentiphaga sp.]